jgi:hypothetical protein
VHRGLFYPPKAATILLNRDSRSFDLSRTRFATQLRDEFKNLTKACCTDWVTLTFEAP